MEGVPSPPPMPTSNNGTVYMTPILICMLGIIVTSTVIVVYHFYLIKYCFRRNASRTTTAAARPNAGGGGAHSPGVDEKLLETIPIFKFSVLNRVNFETDQDECVVCLGELEEDDLVRFLPNCEHAFHVECIDEWFKAHTNCPLCRSPIVAETNPASFSSRLRHSSADNDSDSEIGNEQSTSNYSRGGTDSSPRVQPSGRLRHCASMALPAAAAEKTPPRLKRSLSMDQFCVIIDLQSANTSSSSSSSSSRGELGRSESYSTRLLRSFSRLRLGKGSSSNSTTLPY